MTKFVMKLLALTVICALAMSKCPTNANPAVENEVQKRDQQNFQLLFKEESEKGREVNEKVVVYDDATITPEDPTESNTGSTEDYTGSTEDNEGSSEPSTTEKPSGAQAHWLSLCIASVAFIALMLHLWFYAFSLSCLYILW